VTPAQKKADAMKKHGLLLLLVALLLIAPTATAADFSPLGFLDGWLGRLVALFTGDELGSYYPPHGLSSPAPQSSDGDQSELGSYYPPHG